MTCTHLSAVEQAIIDRGIRELSRETGYWEPCEWVYFECYIDLAAVRTKFALDPCVRDYVRRGTHEGSEKGLYCEQCHDGVTGLPEESLHRFREYPVSNEELFKLRFHGVQPSYLAGEGCQVFPG